MRKVLVGLFVGFAASAAYAAITHSVVAVDNSSGRPTDADYYTWDLLFIVTGRDDWTVADIFAEIDADEIANVTWNPRTTALKPPPVRGSPPPTWDEKFRNMVSSPLDWPNTLDNADSTLATTANDTSNQDKKLAIVWFDTSTVRDPPPFTAFRLTLRQVLGMEALTLANTGDHVAKVRGRYTGLHNQNSLLNYEFDIYRVPEPKALALLALGGLAGLLRRR